MCEPYQGNSFPSYLPLFPHYAGKAQGVVLSRLGALVELSSSMEADLQRTQPKLMTVLEVLHFRDVGLCDWKVSWRITSKPFTFYRRETES